MENDAGLFWQIIFQAVGVAFAVLCACALIGAGAGIGVRIYRNITRGT